ncbi:MAG: hypothetical protein RLP09_19455 [Sandaracinaceae bacterium]
MRWILLATVVSAALAGGCAIDHALLPSDAGHDAGPNADTDGDGIRDEDEGAFEQRDSDGDGTPDYLDLDSDDDGIPDAREAGDANPATPPRDSDRDGAPDFIDLDSDDNGLPDHVEGEGDFDLDGIPNYADLDDDADLVPDRLELDGVLDPPIDSDGDGRPNFRDPDSDNDRILDGDEYGADTDRDSLDDIEDLDSDGDGIPDAREAGDDDVFSPPFDTDGDGIPDFRDLDSDADGLSDRAEVEGGTSPTRSDTDGDGVSDLIERAAGTDPNDPRVSPLTRGDFVFVVDYRMPPDPPVDTLEFRTSIQFADIYFLFDVTSSMSTELSTLRAATTSLLESLTCSDTGFACRTDGDCAVGQVCSLTGRCTEDPTRSSCIASPWSGGGYYESSFVNRLPLQAVPEATRAALDVPTTGTVEELFGAAWSVVDPDGSPGAETGCAAASPTRVGCVGFRAEAVKILIAFTDEDSDGLVTATQAGAALRAEGVNVLGVWSGDPASAQRADLEDLVRASGSLSASGAPLVFDGRDAAVVPAVTEAINEIVEGVPLRVTVEVTDEPGDDGDALRFVDHLEVNTGGGACSAVAPLEDGDGDGRADVFAALVPGTPVCWDVHPARNDTVPRTVEPQVFEARLTVFGDGSPLDSRIVYFLVPPRIDLLGGP